MMIKKIIFLLVTIFLSSLSWSQVENSNSPGTHEVINLSALNREEIEGFVIDNYQYNRILNDLNIRKKYLNKYHRDFRKYVYAKISKYYQFIYDNAKTESYFTNSDVKEFYDDFLRDTKGAINDTSFTGEVFLPQPPVPQYGRASGCGNSGFENGTASGWTLEEGNVDGSVNYSFVFTNDVTGVGSSQFQVFGGGNDPQVPSIPRVNPNGGGSYSLRLGDGSGTGSNAARATTSFVVNNSNRIFRFGYAVILEDPTSHGTSEKPYFSFRVFDESGNNIQCGEYNVIAGASIPGFKDGSGNIKYKEWTTVITDLSTYIGQTITVEFTTGDCSQSGHYGYAYIDANCSAPEIQVDNLTGLLCEGEVITLSATEGGGSDMNYLWNTGETTESIEVTSSGDYWVEITPPMGTQCKVTLTRHIDIKEIIVKPNFTADTTCINEELSFTDQSTAINDVIVGWNWDFGGGNSSTVQNPTEGFTSVGAHNVTLTVQTQGGCENDTTIEVYIYPSPVADFTFVNACNNEAVVFTSTATPGVSGAAITDYYWDADNNNSVDYTGNTAQNIYGSDGFYTVTHIVEDANGCRDTISQEVTVYTLPNAAFDATFVCEDTTTTFTDNSTITPIDNGSIVGYNWDFGNGSASTDQNPTLDYGVENIYNAQLVVTTNYGCKDSIEKPIKVYPLPNVDFSPTDVCLNFTTQFQDESTVSNQYTSNSNVSWSWDFADGSTSQAQNPTHTYASFGKYQATLVVTTNQNCVDQVTKEVTVNPLPEVSFTGNNLVGCAPICPTLTSTSTIQQPSSFTTPPTLDKFKWILSDGRTYNGASITECFRNKEGYDIFYGASLIVTSNKGCVSKHMENNYIKVYHNPIANFNYTPKKPNVMDPVVDFHNTSLYANTYKWNIGSLSPMKDINPKITFPFEAKTYEAELIAYTDKGCTDTIRKAVKIRDKVIFYVPNTFTPDKDDYNEVFRPVFANGIDPQTYTLYIYNRWGELIFESHDTNVGWDGTYGSDRDEIVEPGTYIWKFEFKETMSDKYHVYKGHVNLLR